MFRLTGFLWLVPCLCAHAQDAPVTRIPDLITPDSSLTVPVTATGFSRIGSCGLEIRYDTAVAAITSVTAGPLLGGGLGTNLTEKGRIILGWYAWPGVTLPDSTVIFNLEFSKVRNGTSPVTFFDDGNSCFFSNDSFQVLNDLPAEAYYINGAVTFQSLGVEDPGVGSLPLSFYPNPFRQSGTLEFRAPAPGLWSIEVCDMRGQRVFSEQRRIVTPGAQVWIFGPRTLHPGIYSLRIRPVNGGGAATRAVKIVCVP
jgi:hypothetical protein